MQTWLDQYTEALGLEVRRRWARNPLTQGMAVPSDYQIMRDLTCAGLSSALGVATHPLLDEFESGLLAGLSPFFVPPDQGVSNPYACVAGRDLVRLFGDAAATPQVKREAQAFAKERVVTYIDVADRALQLGTEHHVKAIVLNRYAVETSHPGGTTCNSPNVPNYGIRMFAVIGRIGRLAQGRLAWAAGSEEIYSDDLNTEILGHLLDETGKRLDEVVRDIENLAWLTLAYASVADAVARVPLPLAADELRDGVDRAARRQRRQFSLFRVEHLRPPAGNFGRNGDAGADGWQLERRIAVRGHFKMQPHGPNGTLRKLIFVDQHCRGPLDGAPLHNIVALDA